MRLIYTEAKRKKICNYALRYDKTKAYEMYEATSLRLLYWYDRKECANSVDFVKRASKYFALLTSHTV